MNRLLWAVLLTSFAMLLLVGCGAPQSEAPVDVTSTDDVQRISPQEAKALLDSGEALLLDTRSTDAYQSQHAAGAISFPEEELAARLDELPDDGRALIFYCT